MESQDLRNAGLKVTLPRLKILEMLEHSPTRHLSAEEIYRRLMETGEDIGLATVYRVLTQFETAGLVTRHHFEGGHAVFELERGHHHDHMVCIKCGHVDEFEDETIEKRQREKAESLGYRLIEHSLIMYGECQRKSCPHLKTAQARRP
ncbi:MAG: ferric iron uptake transcriptional regulator [Nevskia sp.]|nr:ferric iron uptake transcriptional regulator [Nevskia sp.]